MTRKEFEDRTHRLITPEDYTLVENLYMAAGNMNKDEFCDEFKKMCTYDASNDQIELWKCLKEIGRKVGGLEAENNHLKRHLRSNNDDLAEFLIGKASAYNDTDFYKKAVALVGQKEVTLKKLEMGLPLWDEDKEYIKSNLN